jgi:hypothetical protein
MGEDGCDVKHGGEEGTDQRVSPVCSVDFVWTVDCGMRGGLRGRLLIHATVLCCVGVPIPQEYRGGKPPRNLRMCVCM